MRASCKLAAQVLEYGASLAKAGVTTDEIDKAVHKMIVDNGAYPSPLNYGKFPKSVCTSINECLCHGIPDSRPLQDGDILNIDVTVYLDGYHGDCSKMILIGKGRDHTMFQLSKELSAGAWYRRVALIAHFTSYVLLEHLNTVHVLLLFAAADCFKHLELMYSEPAVSSKNAAWPKVSI